MKISGFTMVRNATKLYYPVKQSIASILPLVDEFVVALGESDPGDDTLREIKSLGSDKVKIIPTRWDLEKYPNGTENAHQTDIAKAACSGDWLFYLQADEVVHEKYLPVIKQRCQELLTDQEVEGLLFHYIHFWGDYEHHHLTHNWYPEEIRIIRNRADIHSWKSAQSFRRIPGFNYVNYRQEMGTYKLNVARVNAWIYHYGWVRPPRYMQSKTKALATIHKGEQWVKEHYGDQLPDYDYGPLKLASKFQGTHPTVMKEWIDQFNWADQLHENGPIPEWRPRMKHETLKYRILMFLEQKLLRGKILGGTKNYRLLKK